MLIDDLRTLVSPGFPDAEGGALGIGEYRHPARVQDVKWFRQHAATGVAGFGRRLIGAVDPYVRVPGRERRSARRDRADGGCIAAADPADVVLAL